MAFSILSMVASSAPVVASSRRRLTVFGESSSSVTMTVTVMITEEPAQKTVGLYLIDANSGAELASLDRIENAISM